MRDAIEHSDVARLINRANATILDIGANDGSDSLSFAHLLPVSLIFSFEPDPRAIKRFRQMVNNNQIHLIESALGNTIGNTVFHQSSGRWPKATDEEHQRAWSEGWDLSGTIRQPFRHLTKHPWCTFDKSITIPITTLDHWCDQAKIDMVDFIWADVQGAEEDLILGGLTTLSRTRFFYTEYSNNEMFHGQIGLKRILELLPSFEIVELFENDVLLKNRSDITFKSGGESSAKSDLSAELKLERLEWSQLVGLLADRITDLERELEDLAKPKSVHPKPSIREPLALMKYLLTKG